MTKHLKRPVSILLCLLMVAGLFTALPLTANAADTTVDGVKWYYEIEDDIVYISGVTTSDTVVEVPDTLDGKTVAGIYCYAFYYSKITEITFPETVTQIHWRGDVFDSCSNLKKVTFKGKIDCLGNGVFQNCSALEEIVFEKGVGTLNAFSVLGCENFGKMTIYESTDTVVDDNTRYTAFEDCGNVTIASLAANADVKAFAQSRAYAWEEISADSGHTHTWQAASGVLDADDRTTINLDLVCVEDDTHVAYPLTSYEVVSKTDATCNADGTMTINATFTKDAQEIIVTNFEVAIPQYAKHDYSEFEWTWNGSTPTKLTIWCSHCDDSNDYHSFSLESDYLTTEEKDGKIYGKVKMSMISGFIGQVFLIDYRNRGTIYEDNDWAYYTQEKPETYTVTWENEDGTVLETDENVAKGAAPSYDGDNPTKASTAEYDYSFNGWTPDVSAVTGDITYTATFTETKRKYTITWKNGENVLKTDEVEYGETPAYDGADPTKDEDDQYTYTFSGWTPDVAAVTGAAAYTAKFTAVPKHTHDYTATWFWTENQSSYTVTLKLECVDGDKTVVLNGSDINYAFYPYYTSYNGLETKYEVSAEYDGVTYEDSKIVPSFDAANVINGIALDDIMTTAADAKAQDDNKFGLRDDVYYRNLTLLGVQKKEDIATTDGLNQGKDLRFVAVADSRLLEDAQDYGFIVANSGQSVWNTDKQVGALTAEGFPGSVYSCKDTDNTICGDYGLRSTTTEYKYITLAVNGVDENQTIAARFYVKDSNGVYHYAKYTNQYCKTYQGIAVKYSELG